MKIEFDSPIRITFEDYETIDLSLFKGLGKVSIKCDGAKIIGEINDLKEYIGGAELLRTENKDYSKDFPDHFVEQIHNED